MANNEIDMASLSQHFTEEELASVMPKDEAENAEAQETVQEEPTDEQPATEPQEEQEPSHPDGDTVQEEPKKLKPSVIAYDRFKEVNDKAKALAAELAALKAQKTTPVEQPKTVFQQPQTAPNSQAEAKAKYYAMLSAEADKEARDIHGIKDADLTELQFVDNAKYQAYLDTRATIVQERHTENVKQFQVRQANEMYVSKLQNDPLFAPVYNFAIADMEDLPVREVKAFKAAEARVTNFQGTDADFKLLDEYLEKYQDKYLAMTGQQPVASQATVTKTKAPIEKAEGLPRANSLSGAKTAAMSWQQVEQLIRDGKADQIPKEMLSQIDPKLIE
jgi:hypothetical protein